MDNQQNAKNNEGILTKILGKVTQEGDIDHEMILSKIAEVEEEMKNAEDKLPSLIKANQILEEYSSMLEEHLGKLIARNAEVEAELEATLEEIAQYERNSLCCALPEPSEEAKLVKVTPKESARSAMKTDKESPSKDA